VSQEFEQESEMHIEQPVAELGARLIRVEQLLQQVLERGGRISTIDLSHGDYLDVSMNLVVSSLAGADECKGTLRRWR
jgi:cell division septal protein FtsQ